MFPNDRISRRDDKYTYVKVDEAATPKNGLHMIYVDHYWMVTADNEILIYGQGSPQCNSNKQIAERIRDRLHTECEVHQIPFVYMPVRASDY